MIARAARLAIAALALGASATACSQVREPQPPHNADERLADDVMAAIGNSDMRPVLSKFVPERRADLLDPGKVKQMHDYAANGGAFLGAREVSRLGAKDSTTRYFVAAFQRGDLALTILFDDAGKIVHYRLGGSASDS